MWKKTTLTKHRNLCSCMNIRKTLIYFHYYTYNLKVLTLSLFSTIELHYIYIYYNYNRVLQEIRSTLGKWLYLELHSITFSYLRASYQQILHVFQHNAIDFHIISGFSFSNVWHPLCKVISCHYLPSNITTAAVLCPT